MEESRRVLERTIAHIEDVDERVTTPDRRALHVFNVLKKYDFTDWDIVCFCANYLGLQANSTLPYLMPEAKILTQKVYTLHYKEEGFDGGINRESIIKSNVPLTDGAEGDVSGSSTSSNGTT
jgi:hypothetical protein